MKPILCPQCGLSPGAAHGCDCKFTQGHAAGFAEALEMAAKEADAVASRIEALADKAHDGDDSDEPNYDRYEELEIQAGVAAEVAAAIRSLATAPTDTDASG